MRAQLLSKIVNASMSELPKGIRASSNASTFSCVRGIGKKGEFEVYSFFDSAGKLIKRKASYLKDGCKTEELSLYSLFKNNYIGGFSGLLPQRVKVTAINGKTTKSVREVWLTNSTRMVEEIDAGATYDIHKFQSFAPKEKVQELSYKTDWSGDLPKDIKSNFAQIDNTEGFEYLPLFVSPNSSKRYKHLEKINLKYQDLDGIVPEMKVISKKQMHKKYPYLSQWEVAHGGDATALGCCSPEDGLVEVLNSPYHTPLKLVDTVAHEYQHARDYSDALRLGNGYEDMIQQNIKEKNCGLMKIKLSDFKFNSLKKKGAIPSGSKEYKELMDVKWLIEHENYSEMCAAGKHDDAVIEASAIARGENAQRKFIKAVNTIFDLFDRI